MNKNEGDEIVYEFYNRNARLNWKESCEDLRKTINLYGSELDEYQKTQLFNSVSRKAGKEFGNMFKFIIISGILGLIGYWYFIVYRITMIMYRYAVSPRISAGSYLLIGIVWMISFIVGFSLAVYFIRYAKNKIEVEK